MSQAAITILGGGLAGLSLGIALHRRGIPVTLHEAIPYPRHRVCGEFISGVDDAILHELGIAEDLVDAQSLSTSAWLNGHGVILGRFNLPRPARGISRHRLDKRLADRFCVSGGDLRIGRGELPLETSGWMDCRGRRPNPASQWIGLKCHFRSVERHADLEMHLGRGAYVGLAPVEDNWINVCGLFPKASNQAARGPELLLAYLREYGLSALAERLESAETNPDSFQGISGLTLGEQLGTSHGACVIGDRSRLICPLTGNGMSMALEAAHAALEPLTAYANRESSWTTTRNQIEARIGRKHRFRTSAAISLQDLMLRPFWQKTFSRIHGISPLPMRVLYHLTR